MDDIKVEILHMRDPDSACDMIVFVNGERMRGEFTVEDIDPGAGHERSEWDEQTRETADPVRTPGYSDEFRAAVVRYRDAFAGNKYVEGEPDPLRST